MSAEDDIVGAVVDGVCDFFEWGDDSRRRPGRAERRARRRAGRRRWYAPWKRYPAVPEPAERTEMGQKIHSLAKEKSEEERRRDAARRAANPRRRRP